MIIKTKDTEKLNYVGNDYVVKEGEEIIDSSPDVNWFFNRISNYPPMLDQLDAIWKGGETFDNMKNNILTIKAQFPKMDLPIDPNAGKEWPKGPFLDTKTKPV